MQENKDGNIEVTITLTVDEINTCLRGITTLPFIEVNNIVAKIQEQANEQLEKSKKKEDDKS